MNINIKNRNLIYLFQIALKMNSIYKLQSYKITKFTTRMLQFGTECKRDGE